MGGKGWGGQGHVQVFFHALQIGGRWVEFDQADDVLRAFFLSH